MGLSKDDTDIIVRRQKRLGRVRVDYSRLEYLYLERIPYLNIKSPLTIQKAIKISKDFYNLRSLFDGICLNCGMMLYDRVKRYNKRVTSAKYNSTMPSDRPHEIPMYCKFGKHYFPPNGMLSLDEHECPSYHMARKYRRFQKPLPVTSECEEKDPQSISQESGIVGTMEGVRIEDERQESQSASNANNLRQRLENEAKYLLENERMLSGDQIKCFDFIKAH